jgi:hypothetical protein
MWSSLKNQGTVNLGALGQRKYQELKDDLRTRVWLLKIACDADLCLWSDIASTIRPQISIEMALQTHADNTAKT